MKVRKINFPLGLLFVAALVFVALVGPWGISGAPDIRFGIDIRGGVEATFEPAGTEEKPTKDELESARTIIETRLDSQKILDREVTVNEQAGNIIVRFPWKSDEKDFNPEESIAELGEMAILTFQDSTGKVLVDGKEVADSQVQRDKTTGEYLVALTFTPEGSKDFATATQELLGQNMGIYMDDTQISNPLVKVAITDGQAVITGMENFEEATALSQKINSGALPFSMETTNFSTISPALGASALKVMVMAGILAFALICVFMIVYYRLPGLIACFALCCQVALQLLAIAIPQITLTLPGIAGIILTLGMSVDANIIISERISEEVRKGMSFSGAVKKGYENSFSALFDGNFTTAIVAVILMIFGSGTMLSFGYTLLTGVIINFFAGIFISKLLLQSVLLFKPMQNLKLFRKQKEKKTIPFFEKRKYAFILSSLMIAGGIVVCLVKGVTLDTQFAGGAILTYAYEGEVDTNEISDIANEVVGRPATVQISTDPATKTQEIVLTLAGNESITPDQQKALNTALEDKLNSSVELEESYIVEPYIGKTAMKNSALAIILAVVFIVLYVWIRFTAMSGLSAGVMSVLALVHDMLFVFFTFAVFGIPLNDAFVAVTLTIIGYSINDTIVLYDRIRENMNGDLRNKNVGEVVSISTTQVLGRSINTSLVTVLCILVVYVFARLYGINAIEVFSFPMLLGLISGCYSSVFIAAPLWAVWKNKKKKEEKKK